MTVSKKKTAAPSKPPRKTAPGSAGRDLVPVLINFERSFLARVDERARERGLNRSAFIIAELGEATSK